jgi:hypothetical protein
MKTSVPRATIAMRQASSVSSKGMSSVPRGMSSGVKWRRVAVGVVPGGEAGEVAAGAAQQLDVQSAFGILDERQVEVGDAWGVVEVEIHCPSAG